MQSVEQIQRRISDQGSPVHCDSSFALVGLRGAKWKRVSKPFQDLATGLDRKSTRLNSSHGYISYAVFCLKKNTYLITASGWRATNPFFPSAQRLWLPT